LTLFISQNTFPFPYPKLTLPKGGNSSGDIFLAFSTATHIPRDRSSTRFTPTVISTIDMIDTEGINGLFEACADSVEEAIYNVLTGAESMDGPDGARAEGLPLDDLKRLMGEYYVPVDFV
jgi:D-aminopeptidase